VRGDNGSEEKKNCATRSVRNKPRVLPVPNKRTACKAAGRGTSRMRRRLGRIGGRGHAKGERLAKTNKKKEITPTEGLWSESRTAGLENILETGDDGLTGAGKKEETGGQKSKWNT